MTIILKLGELLIVFLVRRGIMEKHKKKNGKTKPMNEAVEKVKRKSPLIWILGGGGLILILLLLLALAHTYITYRKNMAEMNSLGRELVNLKSAMNIDSVRQYKIQKILTILKDHNSDLASMIAYDIASEIYEMSVKYTNLNTDLLCALITHESALTWDPEVVSNAGAMGLMQIMPVTGFFLAEAEGLTWTTPEEMLFNPIHNIRLGSRFLSMLVNQYGLDGGLAAYNGGEKQAYLWLKNGRDDQYLYSETRAYIPAIVKLYDTYQAAGL
jgi:soluble lytic murein transglycosylase